MAPSPTDISAALQSIPEKKEFLRKVFEDLEEQKATIARCSGGWKELDARLSEIYDALEKRYAEIVDKETQVEARISELQAALDKRESVIESREQASLARVQEQKEAAIAAIREQKKKWIEEKQLLQSQSPAKPEPDSAGSKSKQNDSKVGQKDEAAKAKSGGREKDGSSVKEKEASLKDKEGLGAKKSSKENASLKNNQTEGASSKPKKAKDSTSSTPQKNEESLKPDVVVGSAGGSVSMSQEEKENRHDLEDQVEEADNKSRDDLEVQPEAMEIGDEDGAKSGDEDGSDDGRDEDEKDKDHKKDESSPSVTVVRPELKAFCEKMDGPGLRSFLIATIKKDMKFIRKELPIAMKCASDPSKLVLEAIKDCYPSGLSSESAQGKKLATRRASITLLQSLLLVSVDEGNSGNIVSDDMKQEAMKIAEAWKSKLNPKGADQSALLDAHGFLQLIATYGLVSNFDEDELCNLVVNLCGRKHIPALWRRLGLAHKTSELVDRIIKVGKHVDAVTFVQEYNLAEQFPPTSLLKNHLREIRQGHKTVSSAENKDELHMKELNAAREILKCVEKYKLEDYPAEGLQKRIVQLEKLSTERKRNPDSNVGGSKKPRVNGPGGPHPGPYRASDRFGGRGTGGRNYGLPYGPGGRGGYPFPTGASGYAPSYPLGSYQYGGGPPSYQGPYMR